jgi:large subunit ribosomal protein L4e
MKIQILDAKGNKTGEINTEIFGGVIREDIIQKIVEIEKLEEKQFYAPYMWSGMETSASGNVKHNRHVWKTDRGRGMSRFPKKRMSDKGDRFVWMGAVVPGTRGGRRAHPPKTIRGEWKINKKEKILGFKSGLAMMCSLDKIKEKYSRLNDANIDVKLKLTFIIEDKMLGLKTKEFFVALNNILGDKLFGVAVQERALRCGIGKLRGRKYKKNAGMLLVIGNKQEKKILGLDVVKARDLKLKDFAGNGARICVFTEEAVKNLEDKILNKNKSREETKK